MGYNARTNEIHDNIARGPSKLRAVDPSQNSQSAQPCCATDTPRQQIMNYELGGHIAAEASR
jgi:hypothetical protein